MEGTQLIPGNEEFLVYPQRILASQLRAGVIQKANPEANLVNTLRNTANAEAVLEQMRHRSYQVLLAGLSRREYSNHGGNDDVWEAKRPTGSKPTLFSAQDAVLQAMNHVLHRVPDLDIDAVLDSIGSQEVTSLPHYEAVFSQCFQQSMARHRDGNVIPGNLNALLTQNLRQRNSMLAIKWDRPKLVLTDSAVVLHREGGDDSTNAFTPDVNTTKIFHRDQSDQPDGGRNILHAMMRPPVVDNKENYLFRGHLCGIDDEALRM